MTSQRWIKNPEFEPMNANIQLTQLDQEISRINPESQIDPGSWINTENWFNPDIRINLDSQINIRFESSLQIYQPPRLNWHDQRKTLHGHKQQKFIIKISKWLDPTKMLVESNHGSRINPRTWPDQDVSRFKSWESNQSLESNHSGRAIKSDSRINLESRINCLIRINSWIRPTLKIPSKQSAGQRISRQQYNLYVEYSFYVDVNLQSSGEIILR